MKPNARQGPEARCGGQAMVEFAMVMTLALIVLIVSIQFAILGNSALALNQLAYAGARYASINNTLDGSAIISYMKSIAPPSVNENSGADLNITITPSSAPRTPGSSIQVSIAYDLTNKIFLPNPFLGITFPTTISGIQTTMLNE